MSADKGDVMKEKIKITELLEESGKSFPTINPYFLLEKCKEIYLKKGWCQECQLILDWLNLVVKKYDV